MDFIVLAAPGGAMFDIITSKVVIVGVAFIATNISAVPVVVLSRCVICSPATKTIY